MNCLSIAVPGSPATCRMNSWQSLLPAGVRRRCVNLDPRRSNRWRHPAVRLLVEYVLGYVAVIRRAPISRSEQLRCTLDLTVWVLGHFNPLRARKLLRSPDPAIRARGARSWITRLSDSNPAGNSEQRVEGGVGPR